MYMLIIYFLALLLISTSANPTVLSTTTFFVETCGEKITDSAKAAVYKNWKVFPEYIQKCSYGNMVMNSTIVAEPVQIPCTNKCDVDAWANMVKQQTNNRTIQHMILLLPQTNACPWAGLGRMSCGNDCVVWTNEILEYVTVDTVLHELGHNLGLMHSGSITDTKYGDSSCVMSATIGFRCFNAPQTYALGWGKPVADLESSDVPIQVDIPALSTSPYNFIRLRKSLSRIDKQIFISYRTTDGYDFGIDKFYTNKLSIHTYQSGVTADYSNDKPLLIALVGRGQTLKRGTLAITFLKANQNGTVVTVKITNT